MVEFRGLRSVWELIVKYRAVKRELAEATARAEVRQAYYAKTSAELKAAKEASRKEMIEGFKAATEMVKEQQQQQNPWEEHLEKMKTQQQEWIRIRMEHDAAGLNKRKPRNIHEAFAVLQNRAIAKAKGIEVEEDFGDGYPAIMLDKNLDPVPLKDRAKEIQRQKEEHEKVMADWAQEEAEKARVRQAEQRLAAQRILKQMMEAEEAESSSKEK